ncbi:MAG: hypothetical protein HW377_1609 [Actinobacteria bacterium]|nr:hypothetical protein [Actinomycetota bacterium]
MIFHRFGIKGFFSILLIAAFLLVGVGAWASHGCCGHPSGSARAEGYETADSETGTLPQDNDCISACCQTVTAISPVPHITFAPDPRWFVAGTDAFAASRTDTDIYRPPIA